MKKFLIGCGVVFLVLIVLTVGVSLFIGIKVKGYVDKTGQSVKAMETLNTSYPFTPPPSATLTTAQLEKYFAIRGDAWALISKDAGVTEIMKLMKAASQNQQGQQANQGSMGDMIKAFETGRRLLDEMTKILEQHQMSPKEYQWITSQIYGTLAEGKKLNLELSTNAYDEIQKAVDAAMPANQPNTSTFEELMREGLRGFVAGDTPANEEALRPYFDKLIEQRMHGIELILLTIKVDQAGRQGGVNFKVNGADSSSFHMEVDTAEDAAAAEEVTTEAEAATP